MNSVTCDSEQFSTSPETNERRRELHPRSLQRGMSTACRIATAAVRFLQTVGPATGTPAVRFALALLVVIAARVTRTDATEAAKISLYKAPALSPCHHAPRRSRGDSKVQQTFVRDPLDCSLFYTCFGNRFWKMSCTTPGTVYSLKFKVCVWRNSLFDDCTSGERGDKEDDGGKDPKDNTGVILFNERHNRLDSQSQRLKTKGRQEILQAEDNKSKVTSPFQPKGKEADDSNRFVNQPPGPDGRTPPSGLNTSSPRLDKEGERRWRLSPDRTEQPERAKEDDRSKDPNGAGPDGVTTSEDLKARDRVHNDDRPKPRRKFRYPPHSPVVPNPREPLFTSPALPSDATTTTTTTAVTTAALAATSPPPTAAPRQVPDTTMEILERSSASTPVTTFQTRERLWTTWSPQPTGSRSTRVPDWRTITNAPDVPWKGPPTPPPPRTLPTSSPQMTSQRPQYLWKQMTSPPRLKGPPPTPRRLPPTRPPARPKQHDDRSPRNPYLKPLPYPREPRRERKQQHRRYPSPHTRRKRPTPPPRRRWGPTRRPVFTPGPQWWSQRRVQHTKDGRPRHWRRQRPTTTPRPRGPTHLKLRTTPEPVRWWKPTTPSLWQRRQRLKTPVPTRQAPLSKTTAPPPTTASTTTTTQSPPSKPPTTPLTTISASSKAITTTMSTLRKPKTTARRPRFRGTTRPATPLTLSTTPAASPTPSPSPASPTNTTMSSLTTDEAITLPHRAQMAEHCGIMARPMIIGGRPSRPGQWPWQASLQIIAAVEPWHRCGGVLIHQSWVLTAAHCVEGPFYGDIRNWRVVLGEDNLQVESGREIYRRIARIISHPGYIRTSNFPNDVALLQLDEGVDLSSGEVRVACLPDPNTPPPDLNHCWISGWGETRGSGGHENAMNELPVRLLDNEDCASMWLRVGIHVLDDQLCVGYGDTGACYGDSGGPLMCEQDGRYYTTGVMSWLINNCSARGFPNVFTRVTSYLDWIYERLDFYEWWRYN